MRLCGHPAGGGIAACNSSWQACCCMLPPGCQPSLAPSSCKHGGDGALHAACPSPTLQTGVVQALGLDWAGRQRFSNLGSRAASEHSACVPCQQVADFGLSRVLSAAACQTSTIGVVRRACSAGTTRLATASELAAACRLLSLPPPPCAACCRRRRYCCWCERAAPCHFDVGHSPVSGPA